ncbi:MAG: zinc-binding dehydrogenase, partial [Janthinobacterium lividum]
VWRIPENVKVEEAAGVSLVALTAAQAIWYRLGLAAPFEYDRELVVKENPAWAEYQNAEANGGSGQVNFFIYGASTAVGLYAAQMIRLSAEASGKSVRLFGAASKARWPMLKSEPYSYDHLVDYRDDDWPEQITKLANGGGMHYVYDCISEGTSVQRSLSTLSPNGRAAIVRSREGGAWSATAELPTEPIYGGVWEGLGEEVQYTGFTIKKSVAARHFAVEFYKWLSGVVGSKLMPVPIRSMPGGLERVVQDGFQLLGASTMNPREAISRDEEWMKPVSAEKLVYQM